MKREPENRSLNPQPELAPGPSPAAGAAGSSWPDSLTPRQLRDLALADLARRLGIATESIAVRALARVDWPDASLGCPEPGFMYAQVVTPGYRIILEAGNQLYAYHASLHGVRFCAQPATFSSEEQRQIEGNAVLDSYGQ